MTLEFVPLDECVFCDTDGAVLVALIASKLLIDPRMSVSRKPQATLWFPLFDCPYKTFNAVLTSIDEVFFMLDDLTDFTNEGVVVADHSIKAIIGMDASRPAVVQ